MNVNANKLGALVDAQDKRLKRLPKRGDVGHIPETTFRNHRIGQVPSLAHACTYKRVLRLKCEDWLVACKETPAKS